jgi:hypothetical protein
VESFVRGDGSVMAIVHFGEGGWLSMHVESAAGARALAEAFTRASDLIESAGNACADHAVINCPDCPAPSRV